MDVDTDESPNWMPGPGDSTNNTIQYNRFIRMIMATGTSYRAAAKIGNGLIEDLVDVGYLPRHDALVLTKTKIEREVDQI